MFKSDKCENVDDNKDDDNADNIDVEDDEADDVIIFLITVVSFSSPEAILLVKNLFVP